MGDDQAMVDDLQRVCGYMLTGSVQEHVLFSATEPGQTARHICRCPAWHPGIGAACGYAAVAPISIRCSERRLNTTQAGGGVGEYTTDP